MSLSPTVIAKTLVPEPQEPLLIAGASVRAAVHSALRAGARSVIAADLFADRDLSQPGVTHVCHLANGYSQLPELTFPAMAPGAWLYTGAMENHPDLLKRVRWSLLGNDANTVQQVRNPFVWTSLLESHGFHVLPVADRVHATAGQRWMLKPRNSAAGLGVTSLGPSDTGRTAEFEAPKGFFLQQWAEGQSLSGVFVAAERQAYLLGVTRQLLGPEFGATEPFQYAGSIGPLDVTAPQRHAWERLGQVLAAEWGLTGLFGIDAIVAQDTVWPVEINPRYTASIEVLERAGGASIMGLHFEACRRPFEPKGLGALLPRGVDASASVRSGKLIVYARQPVAITQAFSTWIDRQNEAASCGFPAYADLPWTNTRLAAGQPVLTVFAEVPASAGIHRLLRRLVEQAERVHAHLPPCRI